MEHIVSCLGSKFDQKEDTLRSYDIDACTSLPGHPLRANDSFREQSWVKSFYYYY